MILDELLIKLGVKADTSKINEFAATVSRLEGNTADKSVAAIASAAGSLSESATNAAEGVKNLNDEIKNTTGEIEKAGSAEKVAAEATSKAAATKSRAWQMVGMSIFAVAGFAVVVGRAVSNTISKIGDYAKAKNQLYKISKEEVKQADAYTKGIERTSQMMDSIKARVALGLLPTLNSLLEAFSGLLVNNKELISEGLISFVKAVAAIIKVVVSFLGAINNVVTGTVGWKVALLAIVAILAIVKRAMLMAFISNPVTWIILAIIGLIALIDDLLVYMQGGEATFGAFWGPAIEWAKKAWVFIKPFADWLEKRFWLLVSAVIAAFQNLWNFVKNIFSIWTDEGSSLTDKLKATFLAMVDYLIAHFKTMFELILGLLGISLGDFSAWIDKVKDIFSGVVAAITEPFKAAFAFVENLFNNTIGKITNGISAIGKFFGSSAPATSSAAVGAQNNTSKNITNKGGDVSANITVVSPDPMQAGNRVKDSLAPAYSRANQNLQGSAAL